MIDSRWQIVAVSIAALCLPACTSETEAPIIRPVRAIKIGDVAGINGATFPGRAKAAEEVNLAFRVSGELVALPIAVGQDVKKGDVLARLDQRDFIAAVNTADAELQRAIAQLQAMRIARPEEIRKLEAEIKEAEAVFELSRTEYGRQVKLDERGAGSKSDVDRALGARDRSAALLDQAKESLIIAREGARPEDILAQEAEIKSLESELENANNHLAYTELVAPFAGTIAAQYVENFQTAQAGEVVCRLLDASKIELVIDIPENKISMVPYVRNLVCVFDAFPDAPLTGAEVVEIGNEASATTRTYPVTVRMNQPDPSTGARILPGMAGTVSGTAQLTEEVEITGFVIPESAVFESVDDRKRIWLIDESDMTVRLSEPLEGGELTGLGVRVNNLKPGQWVVTAGVHYLKEGQQVRILGEPLTSANQAEPKDAPVPNASTDTETKNQSDSVEVASEGAK